MAIKNAGIDLHIHPFLRNNSIVDVLEAMDKNGLDIVALESFNSSIYPAVLFEAARICENPKKDMAGIRFQNNRYILNAREYDTKERIHVLTVGYSFEADPKDEIRKVIDNGLENDALVVLDHPFVDNVYTRTAGHISEEKEKLLEELCKEYPNQIALEWNAYCIPWMRKGLQIALNLAGHKTDYHDVNEKAKELALKMSVRDYYTPLIADTDLHARSKRLLSAIGRSRLIVDVEGESAKEILSSMKRSIFAGRYSNMTNYVSAWHLARAFILPMMLPRFFDKPRA